MNMPVFAPLLLTLWLLVFFSGCDTLNSSQSSRQRTAPGMQTEFVQNYLALEKGMTSEEIRERFGEPEKIDLLGSDQVSTEVWHYSEVIESKVESNTQGMLEEYYWDIFENRMKTR